MIFECDGVEVGELDSRRAGEVIVEEDFLDDQYEGVLVETFEKVDTRRWRRKRGQVGARLHEPQEAGVHHHDEMAVRSGACWRLW